MTAESSSKIERRFVPNVLPWVVGAAALTVYLITLNHWVTLTNLNLVSRVNGWTWGPMLMQPLLALLTLPFRWLPAAWVPLALNLFTAVCAALTLATLARSVALLPHDRLEEQRVLVRNEHALLSVPDAWVPVVLAAIALGLQLTFWEHATAASGEMLDLLVFAYIIRCLLEHRIDQRQSWLDRATFLFGCAMANNWGMIGFLPLFVVALLRTKRLSFFSLRTVRRIDRSGWERVKPALKTDLWFFLRMVLLGLAGLSLFLVLPLLQAFSPDPTLSFWEALSTVAVFYWQALFGLARVFVRVRWDLGLLLAAATLLPVFLLSIRWGAFAGGDRHAKFDLAALISHLAHAFLLLICLWSVFDPPFSPRQAAHKSHLALLFLPLYYLTALSIGYYSGFFLLVFGRTALERTSWRRPIRRLLCQVVPILVYVSLGVVPIGLLVVNVPAMRAIHGSHLRQYARQAASSLPSEGALVLSEDPIRLAVLQAELARAGKTERYLPVETRRLPLAPYRAWLSRKYPGRWPDPATEADQVAAGRTASQTNVLDGLGIVRLMTPLALSNRVYCLQPSTGMLLEQFSLQPHGLLQEMKFYPREYASDPPLTPAELAENQAFWQQTIETSVKPILSLVSAPELPRSAWVGWLMQQGHLQTPPPAQARVLARWYSGALNRWGVTLQRNERVSDATACFALAQELDPDNLQARVNWQCNSNLLTRQPMTVDRSETLPEEFNRRGVLNQMLSEYGPFDEPTWCYQFGRIFVALELWRQAIQQFERVQALAPGDITARLDLGNLYNRVGNLYNQVGWFVRALQTARGIHAEAYSRPLDPTNKTELAFLEARAHLSLTNLFSRAMAGTILDVVMLEHPGDASVAERAADTFAAYGDLTNALKVINQVLELNPNRPTALAKKGGFLAQSGDLSNAIPLLTRSLSLTNDYGARLTRAVTYMQSGRLDESEADFKELLSDFPTNYLTYPRLGELALRRQDTNAAIQYFERFLTNVPPNSLVARVTAARLRSLQAGGP